MPGDPDRIAGVHIGGVTAEYRRLGPLRVRTSLDLRPEFAAVHSLAISAYGAGARDPSTLPSVARNEGYYFAAGAVVAPLVELGIERWTLGVQARLESYWGLEGADRRQDLVRHEVALHDLRAFGRSYVAFAPGGAFSVRLAVEQRTRAGVVGDVGSRVTESALIAGMGVIF